MARYFKLFDDARYYKVEDKVTESNDHGKTWSQSKLTARDLEKFHSTGLVEDSNQDKMKKDGQR